MRTVATLLSLCLWCALGTSHARPIEPSDSKLRQVSSDLYPAIMARDGLEAPFVVGVVFDSDLRVVSHSGSMPARRGISTALLPDMFPRQDPGKCETAGLATVRPPRGVGGQFDQGVFAVWCVLRESRHP